MRNGPVGRAAEVKVEPDFGPDRQVTICRALGTGEQQVAAPALVFPQFPVIEANVQRKGACFVAVQDADRDAVEELEETLGVFKTRRVWLR